MTVGFAAAWWGKRDLVFFTLSSNTSLKNNQSADE